MKFNFEFAEKISRTYSDECRPLCHVNEGYLERKPVENDRRKTELVCTKKAGTVIERGRRIQQQFTANLFAGIDEEQKKQLTIVMEQLENNMDEIIRRKSHK